MKFWWWYKLKTRRPALFHVKHKIHIANVGAPLSQKTTSEMLSRLKL